jgi:hypothetical protein
MLVNELQATPLLKILERPCESP